MTIYVEYRGYCVELPQGDTVVGRDMACTLRFNDAALSRRHLMLIRAGDDVAVEDLGSTNGSFLNGQLIAKRTPLRDRDAIELAGHQLLVRITDDSDEQRSTRRLASFKDLGKLRTAPANLATGSRRRCPRCTTVVMHNMRACPICEYSLSARPTTVTIPPAISINRRRHDRRDVELRLVYSSSELEIEGTTHDLSQSGVFVCTEVFDAPGTVCELTFTIEGARQLRINGIVRRVVEKKLGRQPVGLAIEFTDIGDAERSWIDAALAGSAATAAVERVDPTEAV